MLGLWHELIFQRFVDRQSDQQYSKVFETQLPLKKVLRLGAKSVIVLIKTQPK